MKDLKEQQNLWISACSNVVDNDTYLQKRIIIEAIFKCNDYIVEEDIFTMFKFIFHFIKHLSRKVFQREKFAVNGNS